MHTPRSRTLVSAVVLLAASLGLGACAGAPARQALDAPAPVAAQPSTVRFENEGLESVDVYLVAEARQWLLGRVPPGARSNLRLPATSLGVDSTFVQLAVVAVERGVPAAARGPRAMLSVPQPPEAMLAQRWTFADGTIRSARLIRP